MKILGIETATIVCGAAVVVDGAVHAEKQVQQKNVHAERIMGLIDGALKNAEVTVNALDAIAVSIGPGSFTGLRIGLSVAKGLCFALDKPLVAVPTLTALAQRSVDNNIVQRGLLLSALDARRDEVYCQLFRSDGNKLLPDWEVRDLTIAHLFQQLGERTVVVTGDARAKLALNNPASLLQFVPDEFASCSAAAVGKIGAMMASRSEFADARTIEPMYVKEFYTVVNRDAKAL